MRPATEGLSQERSVKKDPKPLNPFYRAVFPLDRDKLLTTDGHSLMDKDWGRAIGFVLARHRCGRAHNPYGGISTS